MPNFILGAIVVAVGLFVLGIALGAFIEYGSEWLIARSEENTHYE